MRILREYLGAILLLLILVAGDYSALAASWNTNQFLSLAVQQHTATLLPNGKVLVCGGHSASSLAVTNAALYDPATGAWTNTFGLKTARQTHTAVLLTNGLVLVAGGLGSSGALTNAELYDPVAGSWTPTGSLNIPRYQHTATLLLNGQVLVAGGETNTSGGITASAELYDPATRTWSLTDAMSINRYYHTATLLADGRVLVAHGAQVLNTAVARAEIYDLATGHWTATSQPNVARYEHTATLLGSGQVLVAGGAGNPARSSSEIYDPAANTWTATGLLPKSVSQHTATLLPNGQVLVTGFSAAELYDPASQTWTNSAPLWIYRYAHTATLLPNGQVMVAGGYSTNSPTASVESYEYASGIGGWTSNVMASVAHGSSTLLPNGQVLVAGGPTNVPSLTQEIEVGMPDAQIFDPVAGSWRMASPMHFSRAGHTATLLPNGNVLVAGGYSLVTNSNPGGPPLFVTNSELYITSNGTWTVSGALMRPRDGITATLLMNGKVLIAGGDYGGTNAEIYSPTDGTWALTGSLNVARYGHTATLLPNGKVLVAGGSGPFASGLASAELYNPVTGTWTVTGTMSSIRLNHTATLLPNGKVLVTGGMLPSSTPLGTAETYDPATGTWTTNTSMNIVREAHTAILLPDGRVLVAGGYYYSFGYYTYDTKSAEVFDPASQTWKITGSLATHHVGNSATLLPDGRVLLIGATNAITAEVYDPGLGHGNPAQPPAISLNSTLAVGNNLTVSGGSFRGATGGSGGGTQGSPSDFPLLQLRRLEGGQTAIIPASHWTTNQFTTLPLVGFSQGYALATVVVNGIRSTSSIVNVILPPLALNNGQTLSNGTFRLTYNYYPGAVCTISATTDLALPFTNWPVLGAAIEFAPGQFQFNDTQAKYIVQRFYSVTGSP